MNLDDRVRLAHLLLDLAERWDKAGDRNAAEGELEAAAILTDCATDLRALVGDELIP